MPDILHRITIKSPPGRVYEALSTAEGVRNWWTRETVLDTAEGGFGEFSFCGGKNVKRVRIEKLSPGAEAVWKVVASSAQPYWEGTVISFQLRAEDGVTVLNFSHRGFREESESFAMTSTGWAYFLV